MNLLKYLPQQSRSIIQTVIYGLISGLAAVAFHYAIDYVDGQTLSAFAASGSPIKFLVGSFFAIMSAALIGGWLLSRYSPDAAGSGIPQVKVAFWQDFGYIPGKVAWVKFLACSLGIGSGIALGREGPSVQIGSSLASTAAGWFGIAKQGRRAAVAGASAAALAASFNAPLAAIVFVLEEIVEDLHSRFIGTMVVTSVIGAFCVYFFIGKNPAFILPNVTNFSWPVYLLIPFVAGISAAVGIAFQVLTLHLRNRSLKWRGFPNWLKPSIGAFLTFILGVTVFFWCGRLGVFGMGYNDLTLALNDKLTWNVAAVLLIAKVLASSFCYGFGNSGGIFAPSLFFGGTCGAAFAGLLTYLYPLTSPDRMLLAVVGSTACLAAVVRAPITSIVIVFEMTHEFAMVPALLLGTLVSQVVARSLQRSNIYEALLNQTGIAVHHLMPPRDLRSWNRYPIFTITNFKPFFIKDLSPNSLKEVLENSNHTRYPVVEAQEGTQKLRGLLLRNEIEKALFENREPLIKEIGHCVKDQTIADVQKILIDSPEEIVVVLDAENGSPIGILTLHDLLRAQMAFSEAA